MTAVSDSLRRATVEQLGLEASRIAVIPNFIDPQRYEEVRATAGARRWAKPGEKILLHISNFRPVKRIMDVLDVFFEVRKAMPARLLLVGDGPDRAKAEERCRRAGTCGSVTFLGNIAAVEEVLHRADLFLLPSESESFGLAALEALSCAVPVVASTAGGIPEVVRDGVDGLLFPVGDVAAMGAGAIGLLTDPERHARFAAAAREGAVARFAQERIVGQYRALYERVLQGMTAPLAPAAPPLGSRREGRDLTEGYLVAVGRAEAEVRELGSRFLAYLAPAPTAEAAKEFLEGLRKRYPDATHHCFAWRIGWPAEERAADAGEPSGTAGQPILRALAGAGITDVVAVVVRWFGGTKLGKGGLARAYTAATQLALEALPTRRELPRRSFRLRVPYERIGAVKRLVRAPAVELASESYLAEAEIVLAIVESELPALLATLEELGIAAEPVAGATAP